MRVMEISLKGVGEVGEVEGTRGSFCFRLEWMMEGRWVLPGVLVQLSLGNKL